MHRKNTNNNHNQDPEDFFQELRMSIVRAAVYYKRQVYVEGCFDLASKHIPDSYVGILDDLRELWEDRARHGAGKVLFGPDEERELEEIVREFAPPDSWPDKTKPIQVDGMFSTYCKTIIWNAQKTMGKKITREKSIRFGMASLSQNPNLATLTTAHPKVPRKPTKKN